MARWFSIWNKEDNWAHGLIDDDETAYENGTMIDSPHGDVSLEDIGFNISAILNVGSFKTYSRRVLTHDGNTLHTIVESWKTKHHDYFLEKESWSFLTMKVSGSTILNLQNSIFGLQII